MDGVEEHDDIETADRRMRESEKEIEELGITEHRFENIEGDYQDLLYDIGKDQTLEGFRIEYEKLHKTLRTVHETEKRYIKMCKGANSEIASIALKVQIALKMNHEDNNAIEQTKNDVESTWKLVDQSRDHEELLKKKLTSLKHEMDELNRKINSDGFVPLEQQQLLEELKGQSEAALAAKDDKAHALNHLRTQNSELLAKKSQQEEFKANFLRTIEELEDKIKSTQEETKWEENKKVKLDEKMEETKKASEEATELAAEKEHELAKCNAEIEGIQQQVAEVLDKKGLQGEKVSDARCKNKALKELNDKLEKKKKKLADETVKRNVQIKELEDDLEEKQAKNSKALKKSLVINKKITLLLAEKKESEFTKEQWKHTLQQLLKDNTDLQHDNDSARKQNERLIRDIKKMNKECINSENQGKQQSDEITMKSNELRKIMNEVKALKKAKGKHKAVIEQLRRDEDKYALEASNAYSKYIQTCEQVKIKNSLIAQLQKENIEEESKLKQQQNLYEAVRSDRNIYSKQLLDADAQKSDDKKKYSFLTHQIAKHREEISSKNNLLRELESQHSHLEAENKANQEKKRLLTDKDTDKEKYIRDYDNEINKLKYYIAEAEQEKLKQNKEYEMVVNDRDILGAQLIKRNEELASLYEKIKIQQSSLLKGEVQFQQRASESDGIRHQIAELKRELILSNSQVSCIDTLKKEIYLLEKDCLGARTKVRALSEELQNPMNVHRYRKLEGTNPEIYEMITKIQMLQRRLIAKTEEVSEKDFLIQEKEKLYIELKNILARQPKPGVADQLGLYRENLKEKTEQMKKMVSELNSAHAQVNVYKFEIGRLNKAIRGMKGEWFDLQKKQRPLPAIPEEYSHS